VAGVENGASSCRVAGYVEHFDWPEGRSPAYIVQTVDDGWHYEFRPSDLLQLLPHAKIIAALRERLERIDQGPFGEPLPQLAAEADALQEVVGTAREIRRLWKRVWLYSGGVVRVSADAYDSEGSPEPDMDTHTV